MDEDGTKTPPPRESPDFSEGKSKKELTTVNKNESKGRSEDASVSEGEEKGDEEVKSEGEGSKEANGDEEVKDEVSPGDTSESYECELVDEADGTTAIYVDICYLWKQCAFKNPIKRSDFIEAGEGAGLETIRVATNGKDCGKLKRGSQTGRRHWKKDESFAKFIKKMEHDTTKQNQSYAIDKSFLKAFSKIVADDIACLYLVDTAEVMDGGKKLFKYGRTKNLKNRFFDHAKTYGNKATLSSVIFIPTDCLPEAEATLKACIGRTNHYKKLDNSNDADDKNDDDVNDTVDENDADENDVDDTVDENDVDEAQEAKKEKEATELIVLDEDGLRSVRSTMKMIAGKYSGERTLLIAQHEAEMKDLSHKNELIELKLQHEQEIKLLMEENTKLRQTIADMTIKELTETISRLKENSSRDC